MTKKRTSEAQAVMRLTRLVLSAEAKVARAQYRLDGAKVELSTLTHELDIARIRSSGTQEQKAALQQKEDAERAERAKIVARLQAAQARQVPASAPKKDYIALDAEAMRLFKAFVSADANGPEQTAYDEFLAEHPEYVPHTGKRQEPTT